MNPSLRREIYRLVALVSLAMLVSALAQAVWPLVLALFGYGAWQLYQLWRLFRWVNRQDAVPPNNSGLWSELTLKLERSFKREARARTQLKNTIKRSRDSVRALADGVIITNSAGQIEYWNPAAGDYLRLRQDKDRGQPLTNLIREPRFHAYCNQGEFGEPLEISAPGDDNRILEILITEFGPGDRLLVVRDVSRMRQLEQMRKDFVSNVSHELKTPLTVLRGYLETLLDSTPDNESRLRRALEQMNQQSGRMQDLVHDLLLLSRLESVEVQEQQRPVPLYDIFQRLCADARSQDAFAEHRFELDIPEDARLVGHYGELESAFDNLLTNAVKYTGSGGRIRVTYREDADGAHLAVQDNGMGIDPAHIPRLTERFYRPDQARVAAAGGTGLGLAIVKHVLLHHDAHLDITSEPGKGSTFTCHFPAAQLVRDESVAAP